MRIPVGAVGFIMLICCRLVSYKPQVQAFIRTLGTGHQKREIRWLPAQRRVLKKSGIQQARLAFRDEEQILQPSRFIRPKARGPEADRSFKASKIKRFFKILTKNEEQTGTSSNLQCPRMPLVRSMSIPNLPAEYEYKL